VKIYLLEREQRLPLELGEAWAFFSDPRNLARITPAFMRFEITTPVPDRIYEGLIVGYRVRPLLDIPVTWVTEITHVAEPLRFIDEQRLGPYRFWHHQHHFTEIDGGTQVRDAVHYALPLDPAVRILHRWLVKPQLERIFDYRRAVLHELFGALPQA
jgi:ligand-binding SRPBCC domain-containing protein